MPEGSGLTLLELLVVLALAGILGGVAVLGHRALRPSLDLSSATRQVVMDLKLARVRAVTEHVNHRIVFAETGGSYQLQRLERDAYADAGVPARLPQDIAISDCTARDRAIGFRPRGNAESFGTVTLRNGTGSERSVIVDIAGQIRVQ